MLKFFLVFIFCVLYRLKLGPSVRYSGKNKSFVLEMKKQLRETKKKRRRKCTKVSGVDADLVKAFSYTQGYRRSKMNVRHKGDVITVTHTHT